MEEERKIRPLWKEVHSNNVKAFFHLKDTLYVKFKNDSHYEYKPVTKQQYDKLVGAQSVGAHFHTHFVKNKSIRYKKSDINKINEKDG